MRQTSFFRLRAGVLGLLAAVLAGCFGSAPTRFYTLSAVEAPATAGQEVPGGTATRLGVGPVALADYLNRPQIVVRAGENEVRLGEFHRWAGSLREDIAQVLSENLSNLLSPDRVSVVSWRRAVPVEHRVSVDILRFDLVAGRQALLKAQWVLYGKDGKTILWSEESTVSRAVRDEGYGAQVSALSLTLADLSETIATRIRPLLKRADRP